MSAYVFTFINHLHISDIWFSLTTIMGAVAVCGGVHSVVIQAVVPIASNG